MITNIFNAWQTNFSSSVLVQTLKFLMRDVLYLHGMA